MLDVTECPKLAPPAEWEYFSPKKQTHTLKYEMGFNMTASKIVWVNGPFKGTVHDVTIARSTIIHQMLPEERALADKAYIGDMHFLCPFKPPRTILEKEFNTKHYQVRQSIERLNRRFKKWNCLSTPWRHDVCHHHFAFYVIASITQIDLLIHPIN